MYAPLTQWLLETYGWRGTTLILGGTLLNVCVCGCLMRDPDWLIEENRLESRSQSVLTVSNSSVCLDEIRKMLEIGTPGETVLDTLVTNVNKEANQQIIDAEKANTFKKYRSESILPTYMYSTEFGSTEAVFNKGSRRSLRSTNNVEPTTDAVFAITGKAIPPPSHFLASTETLNACEKCSYTENASIASDDLRAPIIIDVCLSRKYSSRFSLDESLISSQRKQSKDYDESHKKRGCSLGALIETDSTDEKLTNRDTTFVMPLISNPSNVNNLITSALPRRRHHHNRQQHNNGEIVSNLRRNVPLRHSHHFQHMRVHRHGMNYRGAMLNTHRYRLRASSCPNIYRNSMTTLAKEEDVSHINIHIPNSQG